MNIHKNARLTLARRIEMVRDIVDKGFTPCAAAAVHGVTDPSARKWLGRYLAEGEAGLHDRSSRPKRRDRKSTRLNSSHSSISYAVFCLKKKKNKNKKNDVTA